MEFMHPVLFKITNPLNGNILPVSSYGVVLFSTYIILVIYFAILGRKKKMDTFTSWLILTELIAAGVLGALVWDYIWLNLLKNFAPSSVTFNAKPGFAWQGGILLGSIFGIWYIKFLKLSPFEIMDLLVPVILVGYALGRIGCLLAGCCYGKPTSLAWGLTYPSGISQCSAPQGIPLHPTPLYSILGIIISLVILFFVKKHLRKDGQFFIMALGLYSLSRFVVEFFRGDHGVLFFSLTFQQYVSLFLLAGVVFLLFFVDVFKITKS